MLLNSRIVATGVGEDVLIGEIQQEQSEIGNGPSPSVQAEKVQAIGKQ